MALGFDLFVNRAQKFGISLSENQIQQFRTYYELLTERNKVMNLTAITELEEVLEKHFLDSIALAQIVNLKERLTVMDMGTGAGFPGIPLKIAFPNLQMVLSDSLNKRVRFLQDVIDELGLQNIEAVHGRAEDLARNPFYREKFDLTVSRAVANLSTLSEYCLPFVKLKGQFISYKSGDCDKEVKAADQAILTLGGSISSVYKFDLGESKRAFVAIDKIKTTGKRYPRKAGTPSKEPL